jgi:hypothetical protein
MWPTLLIIVIILVAFGLRVTAAGWGLPYVDHHDEPSAANTILGMMRRGDWDPRFFEKPSLYYYALRLAFEAHFRYGLATGLYTTVNDLPEATYYYTTAPGFFLWGRVLTAFVGALTTLALFLIGRRRWGVGAALIGAVVLAVSPFHVRHSQFLTVDVASGVMTLLALGASLRLLERREPRTENQEPGTQNQGTREQKNKGTHFQLLAPSPQPPTPSPQPPDNHPHIHRQRKHSQTKRDLWRGERREDRQRGGKNKEQRQAQQRRQHGTIRSKRQRQCDAAPRISQVNAQGECAQSRQQQRYNNRHYASPVGSKSRISIRERDTSIQSPGSIRSLPMLVARLAAVVFVRTPTIPRPMSSNSSVYNDS